MKRAFRLGSTSYVYPDDILPNVRKLAPVVDDIELVLFESDDYGANLPDSSTVAELNALARDHDLTFTVHLPLDLDWRAARTFDRILRAVDATHPLDPFAYVLHLDGRALRGEPSAAVVAQWQAESGRALDRILTRVDAARLCIENLEAWSPEFFGEIVRERNLARCVDVGHFWLHNADPLPHLQEHFARTRVIHMHGINGRDHQSLAHQPRGDVTRVLDFLVRARYTGVLTLEVFGLDDFFSSKQVVMEWENDSR
ncbi:MAG: sugar phosphate isomerase/epimerase [Chloroflexi bacterium]|nr:sugar phosphate isomerase/epimerase [Chloroflexota bacterium]